MSADFAPGLERAFELVPKEGSYRVERIEGAVPAFLRGTWYMNGPARFARGDVAYEHWLDGDGMVAAMTFDDAGATFTNRFVQSTKRVDEEAAGRALYRGFGTRFEGDRLVRGVALASPVNVSVYPWGETLLAYGEQGLPWELDPVTLETRREFTFGRRLNAISPFAAHPNFDPATGECFNFGVSFASTRPTLTLYRFAADGELVYRRRHPIDHPCSLHDFGLSGRYAIFFLAPYLMDVEAFLHRGASVMDALSWQPEQGSRLLLVDRESGDLVADLPAGERYCLHQINAFEEGDRLHVDLLELDEPAYGDYRPLPDLFVDVEPCRPVRFTIDLAARELVDRREIDFQAAADFPAIDPALNGRAYRHFWCLAISTTGRTGRKYFDTLVHHDWQRRRPDDLYASPPGKLLGGEPVFVPDPGADEDGAVLVPELDLEAMESSLLVFDGYDVGAGPRARLRLASPIHLGFHTCFHPH